MQYSLRGLNKVNTMNVDNNAEQFRNLQKQLDQYLPTLHKMTQSDPRFRMLSPQDIQATWMTLPSGEQRGIILLAQLHQFFEKVQYRSPQEQKKIVERDINRKGKDSKFGEYTRKMVDIYDQMKDEGTIKDAWYISQGGKTELERDMDSSGVDWIIKRSDDTYVLIQSGTRPGDARDKMRHLDRDYGPKFAAFRFIGTMPMLDDTKQIPSDEVLKDRIRSLLQSTRGFTSNVLSSAFPHR